MVHRTELMGAQCSHRLVTAQLHTEVKGFVQGRLQMELYAHD